MELIQRTAKLAGKLAPETVAAISDLVRSMNCYYSNLIEGHNTHPVDIERALHGNYSKNIEKRNLQLEAFAHIEVQSLIDSPKSGFADVVSPDHITWIHREFCKRLPDTMLTVRDPFSSTAIQFSPGELRTSEAADHLNCCAN